MRYLVEMLAVTILVGFSGVAIAGGLTDIKENVERPQGRTDALHAKVDRVGNKTEQSNSDRSRGNFSTALSSSQKLAAGVSLAQDEAAGVAGKLTGINNATLDSGASVPAPFIPGGAVVSDSISGLQSLKDASNSTSGSSGGLGASSGG